LARGGLDVADDVRGSLSFLDDDECFEEDFLSRDLERDLLDLFLSLWLRLRSRLLDLDLFFFSRGDLDLDRLLDFLRSRDLSLSLLFLSRLAGDLFDTILKINSDFQNALFTKLQSYLF